MAHFKKDFITSTTECVGMMRLEMSTNELKRLKSSKELKAAKTFSSTAEKCPRVDFATLGCV